MHFTKDIIYFLLDVSNKIDIIYDGDLKNHLAAMYNDDKSKIIVKV